MLSGQLRSYLRVAKEIQALVVEPLKADLYLSTWDKPGISAGFHGEVSRLLGDEIASVLPPALQQLDVFFARFPRLEMALKGVARCSLDIIDRPGARLTAAITEERRIEAQIAARFPPALTSDVKTVNQIKMMYSWRVCADLLRRAQAKARKPYDIVVRMRPDVKIEHFIPSELLNKSTDDNLIRVNNFTPIGVSDQFAYGNQKAMMRYFQIFDYVVAGNGFGALPQGQGIYGEAFVFDCLSLQGMRFECAPPIRYGLSSAVLSARDIARFMLEDLSANDPLRAPLEAIVNVDEAQPASAD
jgi:hypothetical protein